MFVKPAEGMKAISIYPGVRHAAFTTKRAGGATRAAHPDWIRLYQYLLVIALAAALWLLAGEFGREAASKD